MPRKSGFLVSLLLRKRPCQYHRFDVSRDNVCREESILGPVLDHQKDLALERLQVAGFEQSRHEQLASYTPRSGNNLSECYNFDSCLMRRSSLLISCSDFFPMLPKELSVSAKMHFKTCSTPTCPLIARPYLRLVNQQGSKTPAGLCTHMYGRATRTAFAPSAIALRTSLPVRMPLSKSSVSPDCLTF